MSDALRSRNEVLIGGAVFGALAVILTTISQMLGLNFPLIPYLQFDLGEIAILLAFFIFGPVPAVTGSFIEFLTLMGIGQNAPWGPVLKLVAILSSLAGVWIGVAISSRGRGITLGRAAGLGTSLGLISRVLLMTVANYLLIIYVYTLPGILGFVTSSFGLVGITLTDANSLALVLEGTALFNILQLLFVAGVSYVLLDLPQVKNAGIARRSFWVTAYIRSRR